jgi:hypothetical protein
MSIIDHFSWFFDPEKQNKADWKVEGMGSNVGSALLGQGN